MKTPFYKRTLNEPLTKSTTVTHDTILTCPTPEELAAWAASMAKTDLGQIWDGAFKPLLDGLKPEEKAAVYAQFDAYRSGSKTRDAEDAFLGRTRAEAQSILRGMNEANRKMQERR